MEETCITKLDLKQPLFFEKTSIQPQNMDKNEEILLCFDLDPAQSRSIEPDSALLLGSLVFSGRKSGDLDDHQGGIESLPVGNYLFTQQRECLNREEWQNLAIEQQKDGLWERYKLLPRLYIRFLHEDGSFVTQLFRPLAD